MGKVLVAKPEDISLNLDLNSNNLQAYARVGVEAHDNNPTTGKAETAESQKLTDQKIFELQVY